MNVCVHQVSTKDTVFSFMCASLCVIKLCLCGMYHGFDLNQIGLAVEDVNKLQQRAHFEILRLKVSLHSHKIYVCTYVCMSTVST